MQTDLAVLSLAIRVCMIDSDNLQPYSHECCLMILTLTNYTYMCILGYEAKRS